MEPVKFWCTHCNRNSYKCGNCGLNACSGGSNCKYCKLAANAEWAMSPEEVLKKPEQNQQLTIFAKSLILLGFLFSSKA